MTIRPAPSANGPVPNAKAEEPATNSGPSLAVGAVLQRMRARLLDLSAKNRLLNYRHPKGRSLRVIDEVPAQLFERLLEGKPMHLAPLPIPREDRRGAKATAQVGIDDGGRSDWAAKAAAKKAREAGREARARAYAVEHDIDPSYELPMEGNSPRHLDGTIQTLRDPEELEELLRKMEREAKTYVQEQGANRLHLMFGFVEWREPGTDVDDPNVARLAPLVLLPVQITRGAINAATRTYRYDVVPTGEDWDVNVTFREKCKSHFDFEFPDIKDDESLVTYVDRVRSALTQAPDGWSLKVMMTLGFVSFGKILMWRDLDPTRWPQNSFFKHEPVGDLLGQRPPEASGDAGDGDVAMGEEYSLDALPPDELPPVIMDADSSQHSALIDALGGKHLVIQGPPGTGKSQTITNLIAGAMWEGKRVLFVAEKRAALDVVYRRLENAGLAPFVLALHSHTAQKRELLDDLSQRIELANAGGSRTGITPSASLRSDRQHLNDHVARLHGTFGSLETSPYAILWRARRLLNGLAAEVRPSVEKLRIPRATTSTRVTLAEARNALDAFSAAYETVVREGGGSVARHPWAGVRRHDITNEGAEEILDQARALREAVEACLVAGNGIAETMDSLTTPEERLEASELVAPQSFADAEALVHGVDNLRPPTPEVPLDLPWRITETKHVELYRRAIQAVGDARRAWGDALRYWKCPPSISPETLHESVDAVGAAATRFSPKCSLLDLERLAAECDRLDRELTAAQTVAAEMRDTVFPALEEVLRPVANRLRAVLVFARVALDTQCLDAGALMLRAPGLTTPAAADTVRALKASAQAIRDRGAALNARFDPVSRPIRASLRSAMEAFSTAWPGVLAHMQGGYRAAVRTYRLMAGGVTASRDVMLGGIRDVLAHEEAVAAFSRRADLHRIFGPHAAGVESPFEAAGVAADWYAALETTLREFGDVGARVRDALWAAEGPRILEFAARVSRTSTLDAALRAGTSGAAFAAEIGEDWAGLTTAPVDDVLAKVRFAREEARSALTVARAFGAPDDAGLERVARHLTSLTLALRADRDAACYAEALKVLDIDSCGPDTDVRALQGALEYLDHVDTQGFRPAVKAWLVGPDPSKRVQWMRAASGALRETCDAAEKALHDLRRMTSLDEKAWLDATGRPMPTASDEPIFSKAPFALQLARLDLALSREPALYAWLSYRRASVGAGLVHAGTIVQFVESGALAPAAAADAYEAALYRTLANAVLAAVPELNTFSGPQHDQTRKRFQDDDIRDIRRMQQNIANRLNAGPRCRGVGFSTRVIDLTDEGLIAHEARKKTRHIAIRELFRRAGRAILALKPCVMMGPQAVAQFLRAGYFEFDLVVMDEASQMRPEDALGAIARSKQVVIVGDPKQLGPSSFFDAQSDGGDGSDDDDYLADEVDMQEDRNNDDAADPTAFDPANAGKSVLERSESILTAAAQRYPTRMLRWHYRSRHPKLIAFSNREFYNERLIVFPTPSQDTGEDGVVLRRVEGAVYGDQRNPVEAECIVHAVRAHAAEHPERSLMVATMNLHQADLIDALLERAEKDDPLLADFRARHAGTPEPFEVKNLENVQGDERDVVMVSVTAGPDSKGKLSLNYFGAVTKRGGERRLNVLFTRAKHRTEVFCSFDPSNIRAEGKSEGVRVMRDYLLYAADANWAIGTLSDRAPDSDFEVAVIDALRGHGWTVHPQVGVAGYFIDLAIVHPNHPGRYLLAIECDGAAYHSAKSARDRDRLRQAVLEGLGWAFHRIWSTDWFRDPAAQAARVTEVATVILEKEGASARPEARTSHE